MPRTEVDHILGYYNAKGTYNDVFYYSQQTARYNIFAGGINGSHHKFTPVFLYVYQERYS